MKRFATTQVVHSYTRIAGAILAGLALIHMQSVRAGWTGNVNGAGYGWAYVSVTAADGGSTSSKNSGYVTYPSRSIPDGRPGKASSNTYARSSGYAGGYMQGSAAGYFGDGADNSELERRVTIIPGDCAELKMDAFFTPGTFPHEYYDPNTEETKNGIDFDPLTKSGTITVNSKGSAGTALWLRGWEWSGDPSTVPNTFPAVIAGVTYNTIQEFFEMNGGVQKFESLVVGNHEFGSNGKCSLIIPYTLEQTDVTKLFIQSDGVAKSTPLVVSYPPDMTVECGQTITYADVSASGGCGTALSDLFARYSPAPGDLHLGPNTVTVEITDDPQHQNVIRTGSFVVNIADTTKPVITILGDTSVTVECHGSYTDAGATASDSCAGDLTSQIVKTGTVNVNAVGTYLVKYNVSDGNGNAAVEVVRTVNVVDTTKPVITATGTPANGVLGLNPTAAQIEAALGTATATDNCGPVTPNAQTGEVSVNGCQRSRTRTWTVTDAAGNPAIPVSRTATWTVDTTAPVITATGTPANGALGFNPTAAKIEAALGTATATDNCGPVTPTAQTDNVIVNGCLRSQTRRWTVTDAAGNPATQVLRTATWTVDLTAPTVSLKPFAIECGNDRVWAQTVTTVTVPVPTPGSGNVITDNCGGPVTVTPNQPQAYNGTGGGVTWTFTDAAGNSTAVLQTVTVTGLGFDGFDDPINGTGGSCSNPKLTKKVGSKIDVKFETQCKGCGGIPVPGQPTLLIEKSNSDSQCSLLPGSVGGGNFTLDRGEWKFTWNTSGLAKASYKLTATLQDGSKKFVWIKLN